MKITIVAATGGIGKHLLEQALAAGHDVTVLVRNPGKLSGETARQIVTDLAAPDPEMLELAVGGADAVLSGLGATSKAEAGVATKGTQSVVDAMSRTGVRRLVVVSASPVGTVASPGRPRPPKHDPGDRFLMRHLAAPLAKAVLREHYADLARMEEVLRNSGLDWTVVRPPRLTDKPLTRTYRTALGHNLPGGVTISRADVAHLMLRALDQPATIQQTVGIAN